MTSTVNLTAVNASNVRIKSVPLFHDKTKGEFDSVLLSSPKPNLYALLHDKTKGKFGSKSLSSPNPNLYNLKYRSKPLEFA